MSPPFAALSETRESHSVPERPPESTELPLVLPLVVWARTAALLITSRDAAGRAEDLPVPLAIRAAALGAAASGSRVDGVAGSRVRRMRGIDERASAYSGCTRSTTSSRRSSTGGMSIVCESTGACESQAWYRRRVSVSDWTIGGSTIKRAGPMNA